MNIALLLEELEARLPELEWKLNSLGQSWSIRSLPRGLFRPSTQASGQACIAEIKADMQTLACQQSEYSAYYLAQRIDQKIKVLVSLCQQKSKQKTTVKEFNFGLQSISTRQQWLQSLAKDLTRLEEQQRAMLLAVEQMQQRGDTQALLNLKMDLGEIEKQLTLAKEAFSHASN